MGGSIGKATAELMTLVKEMVDVRVTGLLKMLLEDVKVENVTGQVVVVMTVLYVTNIVDCTKTLA